VLAIASLHRMKYHEALLIALSTGSLYSYGLNRAFQLAAGAGFDGVEVLVDQRWDTRQPDYLSYLQRLHGIPIVSLHSPFVAGVQGWEHDQLNRLKRTVELAAKLGAPHVVAHLPYRFAYVWINATSLLEKPISLPLPSPNWDADYRQYLTHELERCKQDTGVTVVVENLPCRRIGPITYNGYQMNTIGQWGLLPHLNLDTTHLATWGQDIVATYEQVKSKVRHIHLSNYNGKEHRLRWDGSLPLQRLRIDGFSGILCVELDPEPLEAGDENKALQNLIRCREFCHQHFGPGTSAGFAKAEPVVPSCQQRGVP
jgi:sugar phosphate isomerase/epimerase